MPTRDLIKLLLVDDHPIVRDGLSRIQELDARIAIIGEADSVRTAVEAARRLEPDVILMDVRLPDGNGITACRQIKEAQPGVCVLFLTSYADNRFVLAAIEAGAEGYLLKESGSQAIVDAIQRVLDGGTVFDPVATRSMPKEAGAANPIGVLTDRERMVLAEVAKGRTDKEVAVALGISNKTARNYLDRIFSKLKVHTRTEAALLHARFGGPWSSGEAAGGL